MVIRRARSTRRSLSRPPKPPARYGSGSPQLHLSSKRGPPPLLQRVPERRRRKGPSVLPQPSEGCLAKHSSATTKRFDALDIERWARRGVGFHGDGEDVPSTITRFALDALSRMASSGAYSGESYQRRALSTLGNSSSTMRLGCQAPSRTSNFPPRTAKRPPYFSTVAGTSLRYSASPGSSCTSISTIT